MFKKSRLVGLFCLTSYFLSSQPLIWVKSGLPAGATMICALAATDSGIFAGSTSKGVYFSPNQGSAWIQRNGSIPEEEFELYSLLSSGTDLFVGTNALFTSGGVLKSSDCGVSWTNISPPNFFPNRASALEIENNELFMGSEGEGNVFRASLTNINASSWSKFSNGFPTQPNLQVASLLFDGTNLLAGTINGGVWQSPVASASWSNTAGAGNSSIDVLCAHGSTLFAGSRFTGGPALYFSTNGGGNWMPAPVSFSNSEIRAIISHNNTVYLGAGNLLYKSTDNGITWQNEHTFGDAIYSLMIYKDIFWVGTVNGLWKQVPNTVSVKEFGQKKFVIYPNPALHSIVFKNAGANSGPIAVQLQTSTGIVVLEQIFTDGSGILDVGGFCPGMYIVSIRDPLGFPLSRETVIIR